MRSRLLPVALLVLALTLGIALATAVPSAASGQQQADVFNRIASFPVYLNTDIELETVAEIVAASRDGRTLIYTDAETGSLGFVDISNPYAPQPLGALALDGEPTSVATLRNLAIVAVNTSASFTEPSGMLYAVHIGSQRIVGEYPLNGQPDAVAVSPDGRYVAIVIENERDEDLGDGEPPQLPGGSLAVVDVRRQMLTDVSLAGVADLYPEDPEPEYVAINSDNIAAVTLQENNHIILVDLPSATVIGDFSAGAVALEAIDTLENDFISLDSSLDNVPREPDAITWVADQYVATADEGDLFGGSRGFTIFDMAGNVVYAAGNDVEHITVRHGHYPEDRSENKGSEPEGIAFGAYRSGDYLFVGTERASLTLVYRLNYAGEALDYVQALPSGIGPEGLLPIPSRDLFVIASEVDDPGGIRSIVSLYQLTDAGPTYPTIASADDANGLPIAWGALSALAADPDDAHTVYAVRDSFYNHSSIYTVDISSQPALITKETFLNDTSGALTAVAPQLVNADGTVNLDPEGIAVRPGGGFWLASEGVGSVDDPDRPVASPNLLVAASASGDIEAVVTLPATVNDRQRRWGFEGVTTTGTAVDEVVYVAIQREWVGDSDDHVRIGRYDVNSGDWTFFYYPLELPADGGWVGLSEIVALNDETFAVIERDNQADVYAAIKHITTFSVAGLTPVADDGGTPAFPIVSKSLAYDLLPDLQATGGAVIEKVEGLAVLANGAALVVTDNDGVDDSSGETQFFAIDGLFD